MSADVKKWKLLNATEMISHVFASKARLELCRNNAKYFKYADLINCSSWTLNWRTHSSFFPYLQANPLAELSVLVSHTVGKILVLQKFDNAGKKKIKGHKIHKSDCLSFLPVFRTTLSGIDSHTCLSPKWRNIFFFKFFFKEICSQLSGLHFLSWVPYSWMLQNSWSCSSKSQGSVVKNLGEWFCSQHKCRIDLFCNMAT